jgi:YbbR domain-containing protein
MPIDSIAVPLPFSNIMVRQTIEEIPLTIDTIIETPALISVPVNGMLKDGYSISDIVVNDTVMLLGPREMIEILDIVPTETLDIKNRNESFSKQIRIAPISPLVTTSQSTVIAEVLIDTTVERRFVNIPLKLIFTPYQRVTSERISLDTLIVKGPRSRMENLRKGDITVRISLSQLESGDYDLPATIVLPDYIIPVYSSPQRFAIKIH